MADITTGRWHKLSDARCPQQVKVVRAPASKAGTMVRLPEAEIRFFMKKGVLMAAIAPTTFLTADMVPALMEKLKAHI